MPAKKKGRSSSVDDKVTHSGEGSDVGAPLRNLQLNDPEGQMGLQLDDQFVHDKQEALPLGRKPISSDEEEGQPLIRRSDRLPRNCSALDLPLEALQHHHQKYIDFGSSSRARANQNQNPFH